MEFNTRLSEAGTHGREKLMSEKRETDRMTSLSSPRDTKTGARGQNSPVGTYPRTLTLSKGIREGHHHMRNEGTHSISSGDNELLKVFNFLWEAEDNVSIT